MSVVSIEELRARAASVPGPLMRFDPRDRSQYLVVWGAFAVGLVLLASNPRTRGLASGLAVTLLIITAIIVVGRTK